MHEYAVYTATSVSEVVAEANEAAVRGFKLLQVVPLICGKYTGIMERELTAPSDYLLS